MFLPFIIFLASFSPVSAKAETPTSSNISSARPIATTYKDLQKLAGIAAGGTLMVGQSEDQVCIMECQVQLNYDYANCHGGSPEAVNQCHEAADRSFNSCHAGC